MTYLELYRKAEMLVESGKITLGEFEKMIEPLNEEVTEWTPVSEKVPEKGDWLTTCCFDTGKIGVSFSYCDAGKWHDNASLAEEGEECITLAWKPKPEAWKPSDEIIEAAMNTMKEAKRKAKAEYLRNNPKGCIRMYGEEEYKRMLGELEDD